MDLAAASAGPWLVLGVVLGIVLAGLIALAVRTARASTRPTAAHATDPEPEGHPDGWLEDDLPGFLEHPPGTGDADMAEGPAPITVDPPLSPGPPDRSRRLPASAGTRSGTGSSAAGSPRLLLVLASAALLLVGAAAAIAAATGDAPVRTTAAEPEPQPPPAHRWEAPDLTVLPTDPQRGDPGAGTLAAASVPLGEDGALARLSFEGLVLERNAVGTTVAYPRTSVTVADLGSGPALAHVVLPVWNCLADDVPADPVAAGCRQLPTQYAELASPELRVADDGEGLRISGRFATYVRPGGSSPEWTGRVYPLAVRVRPDGDRPTDATGSVHLGLDRAAAVDDPRLSELRRGG